MNTKTTMKSLLAATAFGATTAAAFAESSIAIDSVAQRWPWNNKVDITYTVTDGQNSAAGVYAGVDFTIAIPGVGTQTVHGYELGASAETGGDGSMQHTVTWTAPGNIKATGCTITATLFPTNVASGNDYMVIDIANGCKVIYEGLMGAGTAGQEASNARYNTAEYKTTKMVLRKVPKWSNAATLPNYESTLAALGGYPTGDDTNFSKLNSATVRNPGKGYYLGIFSVTQAQYRRILGTGPSNTSTETERDVYYLALRNGDSESDFAALSSNDARAAMATNAIVSTSSDSGTFLQRLNYRTGLYFDLPTEIMHEIAARAGVSTVYIWNSDDGTDYSDYVVCKVNSVNGSANVGQKVPNNWGFYDMCGLYADYCLGMECRSRFQSSDWSPNRSTCDVFSPIFSKTSVAWDSFPLKGGPDRTVSFSASDTKFCASYYGYATYDYTTAKTSFAAFRVAYIAE